MKPAISVIVPCFNRRHTIHFAIDSVLIQEPKNYEIIIVDDGSTDGSAEYIESLARPEIKLIRQKNMGVANARNHGIREAMGEYIAFLDSDDTWLPGKLKAQTDFMENHPDIGLVYTDEYLSVDGTREEKTRFERNKPSERMLYPAFVDMTPIQTSAVLLRKSVLDHVGMFDESLKVHEDSDLWNRISEHYRFGYIETPLVEYKIGKADHLMSDAHRDLFVQSGKRYLEKYISRRSSRDLTPEEKIAIQKSLEIISEKSAGA